MTYPGFLPGEDLRTVLLVRGDGRFPLIEITAIKQRGKPALILFDTLEPPEAVHQPQLTYDGTDVVGEGYTGFTEPDSLLQYRDSSVAAKVAEFRFIQPLGFERVTQIKFRNWVHGSWRNPLPPEEAIAFLKERNLFTMSPDTEALVQAFINKARSETPLAAFDAIAGKRGAKEEALLQTGLS